MASVKYRISGKHDPKGLNSATKGLQKLGKAAQGVNTIFKGFIAFKGVQLLSRQISETTDAFAVQQKALASLTQSVNNNALLTTKSLQNLTKFTSKLQSQSIFGDEALQEQASMLASMGLAEDKIKDVLSAAVDLSSSGIGTLESNVRNLSKTLNGQKGELGELIPEFKDLTKEQLQAGEAIDIIKGKYAGFGEAIAGTYEGKKTSFQNVIGDIKEKIGSVFATIQENFYDKFTPLLKQVDEWFAQNAHIFINLFTNLPEIGAISLKAVREIFKAYLSPDFLKTFGVTMWEFFLKSSQNAFILLFNILKSIGQTIWEPLKAGFDWVVYGIKSAWRTLIDAIVSGVNVMLTPINAIISGIEKVKNAVSREDVSLDRVGLEPVQWDNNLQKPSNSFSEAGQSITDSWKNTASVFTDVVSDTWSNMKDVGAEFSNPVKDVLAEFIPEFADVLDKPVKVASSATAAAASADEEKGEGIFARIGNSISTWFSGVKESIGSFHTSLLSGIGSLSSVMMLLSPIKTILSATMNFLQPLINSLLKPFVGFLQIIGRSIGQIIAPVLKLLEPILMLVSKAMIWLYNYGIRPLGNAIVWLICSINNGIAWLINGIIKALNHIPFVNVKWRMATMDYDEQKLDKIDENDLNTAGDEAMNSSSTGSSASYSGVRDITVNIYYDHSYINGDAREIALNIKNEIELAGALGY